ncbi:hypothetical protein CONLIGDRAFT_650566 [Coniochaeta ligniaria NRRL 30616]|uniref:Uncharacterized protein n=1 Tax=Coniochaeta ligniaria NRRL 30616 TaxID=1408157 RepID=A0A1J7I4I7_9PEZI|nr:hypothetical protein CONLIGDRAFT_650566 [Coniochaeta ligniaria NRRL 30616]
MRTKDLRISGGKNQGRRLLGPPQPIPVIVLQLTFLWQTLPLRRTNSSHAATILHRRHEGSSTPTDATLPRNPTRLPAAELKHLNQDTRSAGVTNLAERLGVTNHDGQTAWGDPTGDRDVPLDVEAELAVVTAVGLCRRLQAGCLVAVRPSDSARAGQTVAALCRAGVDDLSGHRL